MPDAPLTRHTLKVPSVLYRMGTATREESGATKLSISSDIPYKRYDWMNDEEYYEVLDHGPGGCDDERLKGGASLLFNHNRDIHLGLIGNPTIENGRQYVEAKLSDADDVKSYRQRMAEGILKDTSVGYHITDGGTQIGEKDGCPIYKFKWAVHEASMVTIPADTTVGMGRSADKSSEMREIAVLRKENIDVLKFETKTETPPMAEPTSPATSGVTIDPASERNAAVAEFKQRCKKIDDFVAGLSNHPDWQKHVATVATKHKDGEANWAPFHEEALRAFPQPKTVVNPDPSEGMKPRDIGNYSILRAINGIIGSTQGKRFEGLEREMSDEVSKKHDRGASSLGFFLPHDVLMAPNTRYMSDHERTLFSTGSFTAAGALVPVGAQGQSLIDLYRNKMHVVAMGAQVLSGLQGNLAIPRQTGGATVAWLGEDATITASNQAVGQLTLVPHRLAAATGFSTQLLAQASPDIETFVRNDLMTVLAVEKDRASLLGTGSAGEPLGIYNTPNIAATVNITASSSITYAEAVDFETNVAAGNADLGSLGYITSVFIRGTARVTPKFANTGFPLWDRDMLGSYPARATNQLTAVPPVIFGNWADLIIGDWVAPEIIVDPYSLSMANQIRIVVHQLTDIGIRHPKSFCYGVV